MPPQKTQELLQKKNKTPPKGPIEGHWPGLPNPFVNRIGTERRPRQPGKEKTTFLAENWVSSKMVVSNNHGFSY